MILEALHRPVHRSVLTVCPLDLDLGYLQRASQCTWSTNYPARMPLHTAVENRNDNFKKVKNFHPVPDLPNWDPWRAVEAIHTF